MAVAGGHFSSLRAYLQRSAKRKPAESDHYHLPDATEPKRSDYCQACGGRSLAPARRLRQYLLAKAQDSTRLAQFAEHEDVKSLRDEIALARMLIERRFNLIKDDADLIAACGSLNTLLLTVERHDRPLETVSVACADGRVADRSANLSDHRGPVGRMFTAVPRTSVNGSSHQPFTHRGGNA